MEKKKEIIAIRVTKEERQEIERLAESQGRTLSGLLRWIFKLYQEKEKGAGNG